MMLCLFIFLTWPTRRGGPEAGNRGPAAQSNSRTPAGARADRLRKDFASLSELRRDPVSKRWVIVDTDRVRRAIDYSRRQRPERTEDLCLFCPGNESIAPAEIAAYRGASPPNESDWKIRVVPNKFPLLYAEGLLHGQAEGMFDKLNGIDAHEVVIESREHEATFASLSNCELENVLWAYSDRILDLKADARFKYILILKNEAVGPQHLHSNLYAFPLIPSLIQEELNGAREHFVRKERCVFCDVIRQECEAGIRMVLENDHFVVVAPFASRFPFETWILPKRHLSAFENRSAPVYESLADILRQIFGRVDRVLAKPPYYLVLHTAPLQDKEGGYYHWHFEFAPQLTTTSSFQDAAGIYVNATPPEEAAYFLREDKPMQTEAEGSDWDLFVCHAREDKDDFVRPLVHKLRLKGLKVWYDEYSLKLGDSLQTSINRGLSQSRYGLVVLSPAFFSKHWPQRELDGLATREVGGRKVILPIWHSITFDEILHRSPMLADKLAASSADGLEVVVEKILQVVS